MWVYQEIRTLGDYCSYYARHTPARAALIHAGVDTRDRKSVV